MDFDTILTEAAKLSREDRAVLVRELQKGLTADGWGPDDEPSAELLALLDERDREYEANPTEGYTIDEVIAYVKRPRT